MDTPSFTAARSFIDDDVPAITVKIIGASYELNVCLRLPEIERLRDVPSTPWVSGAIRAGTSASAPVFWSCDDGEVLVGVGHDDQTWDFGVSLPVDSFRAMVTEIEREVHAPVRARTT